MDNKVIEEELLDHLVTKKQARWWVDSLSALKEELFLTNFSFKEKLDKHLSDDQQILLGKLMQRLNLTESDLTVIDALLSQIKDEIERMPELTVYAAVNLPMSNWQRITDWWKKRIANKFLLDIRIKEEIVAGSIVVWEGKKLDLSILPKLEEWINKLEIK